MNNEMTLSNLRKKYKPKLSPIFKDLLFLEAEKKDDISENINDELKIIFPITHKQNFISFKKGGIKFSNPLKLGVVFSGGQAAGGHNVISGIFDSLKLINPKSILIGFLNGPIGIVDNKYIEITEDLIFDYRNQGGFDLIGSGRTKIETQEQLHSSKQTAEKLGLDGIIIIGGDDSNTNAAILSEYFLQNKCKTNVIGIPKTIDGDLKNKFILSSFGFDTASKVYSEIIGNIARDSISAKKYYHFIKLMGRSASHITLECALKTSPNFVFIAEEVEKENKTLKQLSKELCDFICERSENKKNYGIILIPEGLIEFIPEVKSLIQELNSILANNTEIIKKINSTSEDKKQISFITEFLSKESKKTFESLPNKIQLQLLLDRDPHGNVQVSMIETEKLFIDLVKEELKEKSDYKGKFNAQSHFLGYEGRAAFPSNFDCDYCYNLGFVAVALLKENLTGYMCCISDLFLSSDKWKPKGIPFVSLMNIEIRKGKEKPVIKKALVELEGNPYKTYISKKEKWKKEDKYIYPGPIQYFGDKCITDKISITLKLENS